jgi:MOSC domain-containing protein YiiM
MKELFDIMPQQGTVTWIGIRPERAAPLMPLPEVQVKANGGLEGDRYNGGLSGKRQITLIQGEHLDTVAAIMAVDSIDPRLVRRNIVVRGINLLALHNQCFRIGDAVLEGTGYCHPCSRMEKNLGPGGYNAMRGHGGILARVIKPGTIRIGDGVLLVPKAIQ